MALSNDRLIDIDGGVIRFYAKDHKLNKRIIVELTAEEFIRRFLLHILPKKFRKIRYGGFLSAPIRDEKITAVQHDLADVSENAIVNNLDIQSDKTESDNICPNCHIGTMRAIEIERQPMYDNFFRYLHCLAQKVPNIENRINAP